MSFGQFIDPATGQYTDDYLIAKAFESLRIRFGQRMFDFNLFVRDNRERAKLILKVEGRSTDVLVKALTPFAEGRCAKGIVARDRRQADAKRHRAEYPHMTRVIERGILWKENAMQWKFDGEGEWTAESEKHDGYGCILNYRIQVCDDGTFDWSKSDTELLPATNHGIPCEDTLAAAKARCAEQEEYHRSRLVAPIT